MVVIWLSSAQRLELPTSPFPIEIHHFNTSSESNTFQLFGFWSNIKRIKQRKPMMRVLSNRLSAFLQPSSLKNSLVLAPLLFQSSRGFLVGKPCGTSHNTPRESQTQREGDMMNQPVLGRTEKFGISYEKSGSACLDLFFDSTSDIVGGKLDARLEAAWEEDPLTTLKIIFQLGDPRKGKADTKSFYRAMVWLYEHDDDALIHNLEHVPTYSCYRALLDVLQIVVSGRESHWLWLGRPKATTAKAARGWIVSEFFQSSFLSEHEKSIWNEENAKERRNSGMGSYRWVDDEVRSNFVRFTHQKDQAISLEARQTRKQKHAQMRNTAQQRFKSDESFRRLYTTVAEIFAQGISHDRQLMSEGHKSISGLAAKWAPTPRGSHDLHTDIVRGIVEQLYPQTTHRLEDGTYEDYLSFMTDKYRKELSRQRREAQIPEHFIGSGEWQKVNYDRMASLCRQRHGHVFEKHDKERYHEFLNRATAQVESGEHQTMIKAGALLPHDIVSKACYGTPTEQQEANLQWLRLLQDTKESGKLPSALVITDVSGSMSGEPMEVAISLSLLVAGIAEEPWRNKLITFSQVPTFVQVDEASLDNLKDRYETVCQMPWGMNTNFRAVFELILREALANEVPPEGMPRMIFCFSDMEFDEADDHYETDLDNIRRKYAESRYDVPTIVFWNLRSSRSRPGAYFENGVVFLSGFGAGILKSFLSNQLEGYTPYSEMVTMLEEYDKVTLPGNPERGFE